MRRPGFTLIEVLVAVIVLSIGLVGGLRLLQQQVRLAGGLEERVFAHWVTENAIAELRAGLVPAATQRMGGVDWTVEVTTAAGPAGLTEYRVAVTAPDRAGNRGVAYLAPQRP